MQLSFETLLSDSEESRFKRIERAIQNWITLVDEFNHISEQTQDRLLVVIRNVSNSKPCLFDQNNSEFSLSSDFLLLALKHNNYLLPLDERELCYLFIVSLIYGRYHFQLATPKKQAVRHLKESCQNVRTQLVFKSLFDKYNNPECLSEHLIYLTEVEINILMHILRGGSLKQAPNLPFKISRKISYRMQNIDFKLPYNSDIIYQQYLYARLTRFNKGRSIPSSIVRRTFEFGVPADFLTNTDYWDRLTTYLLKHVDDMQLMADYYVGYFYSQRERYGETLFEKSIQSQDQDIDRWHAGKPIEFLEWEKFPWPIKSEIEYGDQSYRFHQIDNSEQLHQESILMRNCAKKFTEECASGSTSIWSVTRKSGKRLMTLEINNLKKIVQMEGKANRQLTRFEKGIIEKWAQENELVICLRTGR